MLTMCNDINIYAKSKAIYGSDDRIETYELPDYDWQKAAKATAAMISPKDIKYDRSKRRYEITNKKSLSDLGMCPDERFASQPVPAICTGFLIGNQTLVTAGHCIENKQECKDYFWVFDYKMLDANTPKMFFNKNAVYQCSKIIKRQYNERYNIDYTVMKLKRKVRGRTPLTVDPTTPPIAGQVAIIGYPSGLPQKFSDDAFISELTSTFFRANLDSFGGNSGSPVFNLYNKRVVGILINGSRDYNYDPEARCSRNHICDSETCSLETVSRISNIY